MKILSSWDDGGIHDMRIADLMSKYEIETTFYIPVMWQKVNTFKRRFSIGLDELRQLAKAHHIGSHTISHPHLTQIPLDQAQNEIADSKKMMEDLIGKPVTSFCYPRGYYNNQIKRMVKTAGYKDARTTKVGYVTEALDPFETHTSVHVGYPRDEYGDQHWRHYGWNRAVEAARHNGILHFWGHSEEVDRLNQWGELEKFLKGLRI